MQKWRGKKQEFFAGEKRTRKKSSTLATKCKQMQEERQHNRKGKRERKSCIGGGNGDYTIRLGMFAMQAHEKTTEEGEKNQKCVGDEARMGGGGGGGEGGGGGRGGGDIQKRRVP